jgi:hypothetical protein
MKHLFEEIYKEGDCVFYPENNTAYVVDVIKPTITGKGQLLKMLPMWPLGGPGKSVWSGYVKRITPELYAELKREWDREAYARVQVWEQMLECEKQKSAYRA